MIYNEHSFAELRYKNATKLQDRIMELVEELRHDKETKECEDFEDEKEEDEDWDDDEDNPAHSELFMLMEVYKVITKEIGK